jgi:hypothetical protein
VRLALLCLLPLVSNAAADPCDGVEPTLRSVARELQELAHHAADAAVTCRFAGPDSQPVAALRQEAARVSRDEQAITKWATCVVNPAKATAVNFIANEEAWAGERLDAATALCAPPDKTGPSAAQPAADCKAIESWTRSFVLAMEDTAARATETAVGCALRGADDDGLAELARLAQPRFKAILKATPRHAACEQPGAPLQQFIEAEGRSFGARLGFAFAMCSSKARAEEAALARRGATSRADLERAMKAAGLEAYVAQLSAP